MTSRRWASSVRSFTSRKSDVGKGNTMVETYKLWEGDIPYSIGGQEPLLTYYKTTNKLGRGTVIICPGGAYSGLAPHEGQGYATFLNSRGLDAFVLEYRVAPNVYPAALADARRAIRFVRHNAEKFGINPDKIAIMGSSAGGHLAAHASTYVGELAGEIGDEIDKESCIPNAQILCYPVLDINGHRGSYVHLLTEERCGELADSVTPRVLAKEGTPPAFMWHTAEDNIVNVCNTYRYATRLKELSVPVEMHIFPFGKHGLGLADQQSRTEPHVAQWSELLCEWLMLIEFID